MNYANPTIKLITNPVGIDAVIQDIQLQLADGLPWLEKCFGRAWEHKEQDTEGKLIRKPKVFLGIDPLTKKGEYLDVLPNDNITSACFFAVRDREMYEETVPAPTGSIMKQRLLAVIFWVNLYKLDPTKDYVYTEELKNEVELILKFNKWVERIVQYYDERVEQVFDGLINEAKYARYTVDDVKNPYLMHPFGGFRFDILVNYPGPC